MVIGQRRDAKIINRTLYLPTNIEHVAVTEGKLHKSWGMDYFAIA